MISLELFQSFVATAALRETIMDLNVINLIVAIIDARMVEPVSPPINVIALLQMATLVQIALIGSVLVPTISFALILLLIVSKVPCRNNGSCVAPDTCDCRQTGGYFGLICELWNCTPSCLNGGQCVSPNTCNCSTANGYFGDICEQWNCIPPCAHDGNCIAPNLCNCSNPDVSHSQDRFHSPSEGLLRSIL